MKLLTQANLKRLPALYSTEDIPVCKKVLQIKFFTPRSNWTWYGVEYDPEQKLFFGYVEGLEKEWGYFSLAELEDYRDDWGLKIERDMYFKPQSFESLKGIDKTKPIRLSGLDWTTGWSESPRSSE